jgi:hypothetical protein
MKFDELSDKDKEYVKSVYGDKSLSWDERMDVLTEFFDKSERTTRMWLVKLGFKEKMIEESAEFLKAKEKQFDKSKKRVIVTWAQNDTPVHDDLLKNIKAYAKHINATIHVIAGRYKNPTSVFTDKTHDTWVKDVQPYLDANRHNIHKYVSILSDVKIQPTADNPMSSMEGISGINSCIFGSPRVHMQVIPALEGYKPKVMWTTGAVTVENYTDSKSGKKGEFHHTLGFVIVEIKDSEKFFARQVTATEYGEFTDLYFKVANGKVTKIKDTSAVVLGDIHVGQLDPVVMKSSIGLLDKLKPQHTIIHDVFDGYSISHHELNNPIKQYHREQDGTNVLKKEIDEMLDWVENMKKYNLVIVRSNHDDFVDRWIMNADWKKNIKNAREYMEYTQVLMDRQAPDGIIPYIINKKFKNVKTLGRSASFIVQNWELGIHGDVGSGGSRGSLEQFRKLNTKIVVGHYHTPGRKDGALAVGTSTKLRVGYNQGASSWLNSHVIIHRDGKAQHVILIDGEYTTFKF